MLMLVREHDVDQKLLEQDAEERVRRGVTFSEVAAAYLEWLELVRGAKPSTLRDHRSVLSEPGRPHRRGAGLSPGRVMATLGDRPAREISTREIEVLLTSIAATGVAPRTVNRTRALICSVFSYGMRPSMFGLAENPARFADRRAEPQQVLVSLVTAVVALLAIGAAQLNGRTDDLSAYIGAIGPRISLQGSCWRGW